MKLLVEQIYGWGWTDLRGQSVEVPGPFELDVDVLKEGQPFHAAVGQLSEGSEHPLSGLWVYLSQRHMNSDGNYNLVASDMEQGITEATPSTSATIKIMGFAVATQL